MRSETHDTRNGRRKLIDITQHTYTHTPSIQFDGVPQHVLHRSVPSSRTEKSRITAHENRAVYIYVTVDYTHTPVSQLHSAIDSTSADLIYKSATVSTQNLFLQKETAQYKPHSIAHQPPPALNILHANVPPNERPNKQIDATRRRSRSLRHRFDTMSIRNNFETKSTQAELF